MRNRVCKLYGKGKLQIEDYDSGAVGATSVLVEVKRGGICGSDLHYYQNGGIGSIQVQEPLILGHELAGVIKEIGVSVKNLKIGDKVAINPSQPCGNCNYCQENQHQHCTKMQFMGSAKTVPHVQGGFRDMLIIQAEQCFRIRDNISFGEAGCAEPLAVCLHAFNQVETVKDKRVLVTGAGPIGALCVALASHYSASDIVATDVAQNTLVIAQKMGADRIINVETQPEKLAKDVDQNGPFDIVFECSAVEAAIQTAIECIKPRGTIIQIGVAGNTILPLNHIVGKEITFQGTQRFHSEFQQAIDMINNLKINVCPMITHTLPLEDVETAFALAANRNQSVKVQLYFGN